MKVLLKHNLTYQATQAMPVTKAFSTKKLRDFVGPNSWTFFERFGVAHPNFLSIPVPLWRTNPEYLQLQYTVSTLKVIDDAAERALGLLTEFNTGTITKNENQKQYLYQVIRHTRKRNKEMATSRERITKRMLKTLNYSDLSNA